MPVKVSITGRADQQLAQLQGRSARKFDQFARDLAAQGCAALQYRLTGPAPIPHICVKHLDNTLRVVVGFSSVKEAWILLIGPHDEQDPGMDVYTELYELLGARPPQSQKRTKPPCCEPGGQVPPVLEGLVTDIAERASRRRKTRRR